jgi:hypothetical protein
MRGIEERIRGELGYADWVRWLIDHGTCGCDGCGGHLELGMWVIEGLICRSCRCMYVVHEPSHLHRRRWASWCPRYPGVCSDANRWYAEWTAELDRQAAQRRRVE